MKKIFFALVITVVSSAAAFANTTKPAKAKNAVNENVLKTFSSEFTTASNVTWTELKTKGLFQAGFNYNYQKLDAYFSEEGELMATSRSITTKQLPLAVSQELTSRFEKAYVNPDVIEFISEGSTSYFVTVVTSKATLIMKASPDGAMYIYKRQKK